MSTKKKAKQLTPKEKIFCNAYLTNFNGSKAAIKAGYSKNAAAETAYEILRKPHIRDFIQERTETLLTELGINQMMVMKELAKIAFFQPKALFKQDGTMKEIPEMAAESTSAISGFEVSEMETPGPEGKKVLSKLKKVKFVSKEQALASLMKYLGLAMDRVDVTTKGKELKSETVVKAVLNL